MRITFSDPLIQTMSGKLGKESNQYFMTRNGKTYLCQRTKNPNKPKSAKMQKQQERFTKMQKMVQEIMASPTLRLQYEQGYRKQKKYSTLRGYIAHHMYNICISNV